MLRTKTMGRWLKIQWTVIKTKYIIGIGKAICQSASKSKLNNITGTNETHQSEEGAHELEKDLIGAIRHCTCIIKITCSSFNLSTFHSKEQTTQINKYLLVPTMFGQGSRLS